MMKVVTKYDTLHTRELNDMEMIGIEALFIKWMDERYGYEVNNDFYYCDGVLNPTLALPVDEGEIVTIGMVNNSVVVEVELQDQGYPTDKYLMYWFRDSADGYQLVQVNG